MKKQKEKGNKHGRKNVEITSARSRNRFAHTRGGKARRKGNLKKGKNCEDIQERKRKKKQN